MEVINESVTGCHHLPPTDFPTDQLQKHSEIALDTQKKKEFLKSSARFLQMLYKCYTFVI